MRSLLTLLVPLAALPALAEGPGGNCVGQPISCLTDILGQPAEIQGYESILEYQELQGKYGKYFYDTPQGNTRYSGRIMNPDGTTVEGSATLFFNRPIIHPASGSAFRLPCDYHAITIPAQDRVSAIGHNCSCVPFGTRLRLTEVAQGNIPQACKEPV